MRQGRGGGEDQRGCGKGKRERAGEIVMTARTFRTQEANREDARRRLAELVAKAHVAPKPRAKTRLNRANKEQRIAGKKARGTLKANRARVDW